MKLDVSLYLVLWLTVSVSGAPLSINRTSHTALFQDPLIYLTVSPLAGYKNEGGNVVLLDRMLEMHWERFQNLPDDTIGLFSENPAGMDASTRSNHILESYPVTSPSGSVKTSVRYDRRPLNATMDRCLGFWIGYIRMENENGTVLQAECLRIYPTWMNDLKNEIKNTPLSSLMIPGTHNAGAWTYYQGWPSEGVLIEYTYCHEDDIYDQLINGIRSLDVRVGYYPGEEGKFYINHDAIRIRPLQTLLQDVRRFVQETNEIVFLDFHRFPVGFNSPEVHHELIAVLQTELGEMLLPKSVTLSVTPDQVWESNQNILLFYADGVASNYDTLWPGLEQAWGDTNKLNELESYLETSIANEGCKGKAWALMAQLTSTVEDVLLRPSFGVRGYANMSNNAISTWFQRENWYSKSMIVALDFYRATNLIETAIDVNKNLGNVCV